VPGLKDQRGYLLPVDADPDAPEINGYPVDQLYRNLAKLKARSITVLLDACFSGETQKGMVIRATSGISVTPKLPASSKLTILTAAQGDQVASWDEPARHGLFTNHVLDALYGAADKGRYGNGDGKVALGEVKSYLDRNMSRAARRAFGRIQEATVVGDRGAVLVAYKAGKAPKRPKTSVAKKATASLTPPQLDPIEAEYEAVRNANVRATPDVNSAKVAMLKQGTKVYVPGRVKGGKWYAVEQEGKRIGFVYAPLLREALKPAPQAAPAPTPEVAKKTVWQIVLESGITLGDWLLLSEERLKKKEYVALVVEADKYRRQYGSFPKLEETLHTAILGDVRGRKGMARVQRAASYRGRFEAVPGLDREMNAAVGEVLAGVRVSDKASARSALTRLASLEKVTGATAPQLALQAKARHVLEDYGAAEKAYQKWLRTAPPDHRDRKKMALGLFKAQKGERLGPVVGEVFKDCDECPEMVVVPAGTFQMGSNDGHNDEKPVHRVTIPRPFAVGKYEVTFSEWDACVAARGCSRKPGDSGWGRGRRPAINVDWDDAQEYVKWLSRRTRKSYRLLSEAEWEFAARAGTTTPFHFGATITPKQANYDGNYTYNGGPKGVYRQKTVPVGQFPANAFGLHDVHGNVWEWTQDCTNGSYSGAPSDGTAWTSGDCSRRVLRGGSWNFDPRGVRSAIRSRSRASSRNYGFGFRISRTHP
jgi:formylglycine-generating enzyme required for sulfatase activity